MQTEPTNEVAQCLMQALRKLDSEREQYQSVILATATFVANIVNVWSLVTALVAETGITLLEDDGMIMVWVRMKDGVRGCIKVEVDDPLEARAEVMSQVRGVQVALSLIPCTKS